MKINRVRKDEETVKIDAKIVFADISIRIKVTAVFI